MDLTVTSERVGTRRTVADYAALVRVPNLFTAPPDVLAGAALATLAGGAVGATDLFAVAVASLLLYAGGTTLNDYFDAPVDAEERPERPIPSGRVPRRTALALGAAFLVAGVLLALVAGGRPAVVAALLALGVALYDGPLKGGLAGFLAMGSIRGLNVVLGVVAAGRLPGVPPWLLAVPLVVAAYVAAFTSMAASEATGTSRRAVAVAMAGTAPAGLSVPVVALVAEGTGRSVVLSVLLAGGFLAWTGHALGRAYDDPSPGTVGPAVGTCVLALVVLDAAFAAIAGVAWAVLALAFLAPAVGLSRAFDVS
ncbi:4-hydroxybenzoate polyprenyltransferase [halophilic archaeon]|nr:4-hydroxybenzoate polyprenyltransferase [halophilic archaeon]